MAATNQDTRESALRERLETLRARSQQDPDLRARLRATAKGEQQQATGQCPTGQQSAKAQACNECQKTGDQCHVIWRRLRAHRP
jgi:hypothetical protein